MRCGGGENLIGGAVVCGVRVIEMIYFSKLTIV